jgi:hypothetical protein
MRQMRVTEDEEQEHGKEHEGKQDAAQHGKTTGEHREVHAEFAVVCEKPLTGSQVRFGVTKVFPKIGQIQVQVLSDNKQTSAVIKGDKGSVRL